MSSGILLRRETGDRDQPLTVSVKPLYDRMFMRHALSRRVDPWQAALAGRRIEGTLDAARLPRLSAVAEPVGLLQVSLDFEPWQPDAGGRGTDAVRVVVEVAGRLCSACQRCLEPVEFAADLNTVVMVTADEALEGEADRVVVAAGELLDAGVLVEDELLLGLPFAPAHPDGQCVIQVPSPAAPGEETTPIEPAKRADNPFAVLGALKGQDRDET